MKTFLEKSGLRTICNEFLHLHKLVFTASFKALRVVKDEFIVAPENELVLDVVHSALKCVSWKYQYHVSLRHVAAVRAPTPLDPST